MPIQQVSGILSVRLMLREEPIEVKLAEFLYQLLNPTFPSNLTLIATNLLKFLSHTSKYSWHIFPNCSPRFLEPWSNEHKC